MSRGRPQHPLAKLCEESPQPIYTVDERRLIVACNRACAEWLGVSVDQLVGQRCTYATLETASLETAAAAALCPPPPAFLGETTVGQITWRNAAGELESRTAVFLALQDEEPSAVLVVVGPVQDLKATAVGLGENTTSQELHQKLQQLVRRMRTHYRLDRLVGDSPSIRRVREQVSAAIASGSRVLIVGPPGSGREHIARTIVYADQPDKERQLFPVTCSAMDVESMRASLDSLARLGPGAILLLLEVDQLGTEEQVELAGALRSPAFRARVLATARRSLIESIAAAETPFNRELAYALSTLVIELPALRDRREDIPLLAQRMVEEHNASGGRQLAGFAPAALDRLASLPWTGNVDELALVVREACQTVSTVWIGEADLPARVRSIVSAGLHPRRDAEPIQLDAFLLEVERELIERAMKRGKGNKARAARLLGISRARLLRRLEQLGMISRPEPSAIEFFPEDDEDEAPETAGG